MPPIHGPKWAPNIQWPLFCQVFLYNLVHGKPVKPDCIVDTRCVTGENPLWHPDEHVLYWCDIPQGILHRYNPRDDEHERVYNANRAIGGFTIQADGALLLFEAGGRIERWAAGTVDIVLSVIPDAADTRFNDVIADPEGRVFAGTMPTPERLGRLYQIDTDGTYEIVDKDFDIPNGMAFNADRDTFYVTESETHTIHQYDYDRRSGAISNQRSFLDSPEIPGVPDGMTIDATGDIWSARWNGNALHRYDPTGVLQGTVEFPVRQVASLTFGGPDYRDIYVTTAGGDHRETDGDLAGSLFRLTPGVQGQPEFRSQIDY